MKNKKHALLFASLVCLLVVSGCAQKTAISSDKLLADSTFSDGSKIAVTIRNTTWCAEIARSDAVKERGLSGRQNLSPHGGMLFLFSEASTPFFWMKDMHFDLDLVWLSNDQVVDISRNIPYPRGAFDDATLPRYTPKTQTNMVLEVTANDAADIEPGDSVTLKTTCVETPSS